MPAFTVQSLVNRAAALADVHDSFVTPVQWLSWFNTERRALHLFMSTHGALNRDLEFISVTAPDVYPIANDFTADFIALLGVWERKSDGGLRPLRVLNFVDNYLQDSGGPITGPSNFVTVEESNTDGLEITVRLRFFPRDPTGTYTVVLLKAPADAVSLASNVTFPMGLEERVVLGMAKRALIKGEDDTTAVQDEIARWDKIVEEYCWGRAVAQGLAVRNVDARERAFMTIDSFVPPLSEFWTWL